MRNHSHLALAILAVSFLPACVSRLDDRAARPRNPEAPVAPGRSVAPAEPPAPTAPVIASSAPPRASSDALAQAGKSDKAKAERGLTGHASSAGARGVGEGYGAMKSLSARSAPASLAGASLQEGPRFNTEGYAHTDDNPFHTVAAQPLSTFSVDVDTASYANVRRFLREGSLPPADAVRVEELINYFRYDTAAPTGDEPFSVVSEVGPAPWNERHRLVRIGIATRPIREDQVPPRNLVFLVDVSGSMQPANKLPLLVRAMGLLVDQLRREDRVAIVVYAGSSGMVLAPTAGDRKDVIREALSRLSAGGSTNGGEGIQLAYRVATESFLRGGINRVILATDGDFNVGTTSDGELVRLIEKERQTGVFLTVLGFGMGNVKDSKMEQLADKGNGNYAYIDSIEEAKKVLVKEAGATLVTVAKDVKIQVELNPAKVAGYRLIGYENRLLAAEDFNNDKKDAGEIGAGHVVTALYEIVPAGVPVPTANVDQLKYQEPGRLAASAGTGELATVKIRYKAPLGDTSRLVARVITDSQLDVERTSTDFRFAAAVAGFGMMLRHSPNTGALSWAMVESLAKGSVGRDDEGYRKELLGLVAEARRLGGQAAITGSR